MHLDLLNPNMYFILLSDASVSYDSPLESFQRYRKMHAEFVRLIFYVEIFDHMILCCDSSLFTFQIVLPGTRRCCFVDCKIILYVLKSVGLYYLLL